MTRAEDFSDGFLATCVDEYCRRAIAVARENPEFRAKTVSVAISAAQSYSDAEFTVKHGAQIGYSYDGDGQAHTETCNAIAGMRSCVSRLFVDQDVAPRKYSALLPAPEVQLTSVDSDPLHHIGQEEVDADAAEFHSIEDNDAEQVSPEAGSVEADDTGNEADVETSR